jgi:hypothetical protein
MPLTTAGITHLAQAFLGEGVTAFNAANARVGVGDSNTAFDPAHTDLQASTNKLRKAMEATYPTRSGLACDFRILCATGEANFAWNEWGVFNAGASGTMATRKVESLGTKTSAQSWQLTVTITFAIGS